MGKNPLSSAMAAAVVSRVLVEALGEEFEAMKTHRGIPEAEVTKNRSGVTSERRQAKLIPQSDVGATSYWNTHLKMGSEVVSFRHVPVTGYVRNWALARAPI